MTATTTTTSVDELMPAAREIAAQERVIPSKRALKNALSIGFDRASTVHAVLVAESEQRRAERDREVDVVRRRLAAQDRSSGAPEVVSSDPVELTAPPVVEAVYPQAAAIAGSPAIAVSKVVPKRAATWPLVLLALPAFVAIWSGWVDLGRLTGFGVVHPLPGIADHVALNTAITLPVGLETYAAYALYVWLSGNVPPAAARFARWSAIGALALGAAGQVAYHLMIAAGMQRAPWWITTVVACLPVAVLGMGAALRHLVHAGEEEN